MTTLTDLFYERNGNQGVSVPLKDHAGVAIDTSAVSAIRATLRDVETGTLLLDKVDVHPTAASSRGSFPGSGVFKLTFTAADMAAVGSRQRQRRDLTLEVTHSSGLVWHAPTIRFVLATSVDVPMAAAE